MESIELVPDNYREILQWVRDRKTLTGLFLASRQINKLVTRLMIRKCTMPKMIKHFCYYDGPISGLALYEGEVCAFWRIDRERLKTQSYPAEVWDLILNTPFDDDLEFAVSTKKYWVIWEMGRMDAYEEPFYHLYRKQSSDPTIISAPSKNDMDLNYDRVGRDFYAEDFRSWR